MSLPVIVGVDAAGFGDAVDWAADEAQLRGTRLHLVHAARWEPDRGPDALPLALVRSAAEEAVAEFVERTRVRHPDLAVSSALLDDVPRAALVAVSSEGDLLVVGSRGSGGFSGLLAGSTSLHVAAHAHCPVVVVPDPGPPPPEDRPVPSGVVVGVHGREPADALLSFAFRTARRRQWPLIVAHAWTYPLLLGPGHELPPVYEEGHVAAEEQRLVSEILAGWREEYPEVEVHEDIVRSHPAKQLVALSATNRLVVVGRHAGGAGPLSRLGSVSQAVVHHSRCPVAVVPAP